MKVTIPFLSIQANKYKSELNYWRGEHPHLRRWFAGQEDWWGVKPLDQTVIRRSWHQWEVDAVMHLHHLRPNYYEELQLDGGHFAGKRVLEVGCGPLCPVLQFKNCEPYCLDPLIDMYINEAGWPMYEYPVKLINSHAEEMPFPDNYFDAVISVNALDHVDDFGQTAKEIYRVLRPGGTVHFEIEYHAPRRNEPQSLTTSKVLDAFYNLDMALVLERTGAEMFKAQVGRFGLLSKNISHFNDVDRFATWSGTKR